MSQATPLEQLPANNDRDMVQEVLDDLDDDGQDEVDYDMMEQQHQDRYRQYQHDPSQVAQYQQPGPVGGAPQPRGPMEPFQNMSLGSFVWEEAKSPLLFIALFLLLNWHLVDEMITRYLPERFQYSLLVRAVLGGVLFYLVRTFLLPMV